MPVGRQRWEPVRNGASGSLPVRQLAHHSGPQRFTGGTPSPNNILVDSARLFSFECASPGATGKAVIDGKIIATFKNGQHLRIHETVSAGDHRFNLSLYQLVTNISMASHDDFKYCQP
jgi:hypothetical protein